MLLRHPAPKVHRFPLPKEGALDPPSYASLRGPSALIRAVLFDDSPVWLVTRHDDVRMVLTDSDRFSADPRLPGHPHVSAARKTVIDAETVRTFQRMDPPEHGHYRRMVARAFMPKRIMALRPTVEGHVGRLLESLVAKGPPSDLVADLAGPLPIAVISEVLGIPYEDHTLFRDWTAMRMRVHQDPAIGARAAAAMRAYFDNHLRRVAANPQKPDDLLGQLVTEHVLPGALRHEEAVAVADLLMAAGHETTATMIALGVLLLLEHPEQWALLLREPGRINEAVDEMLRYLTIAHYVASRVATADVEIDGETIRAGDAVLALISGANRDPQAFPEPNRFDITRKAGHHLAFGYGAHHCLGNTLAKLEMTLAIGGLIARLPELRLAVPIAEIPFKLDAMVLGVRAVPVEW